MDLKVLNIANKIDDGDSSWKSDLISAFDCIKNLQDYKLIETLLLPTNPGTQVGANLVEPTINGVDIGYYIESQGAGTAYTLTNTTAAINLGTTDPAIVIDEPGTYLIFGQVNLATSGATVVAETAALKVRRTNNTAADISGILPIDLPVMTTLTHTLGTFVIPVFQYTTANSDDAIALYGQVSATLGAGAVVATGIGTSLSALRLL